MRNNKRCAKVLLRRYRFIFGDLRFCGFGVKGFCPVFRYVLEVETLTFSVANLFPILAKRNLVSPQTETAP
jgi:hypothetical protein